MGRATYHGPQLSFSACNSKLEKTAKFLGVHPSEYWSFDLRAGITCPYARDCKSVATPNGIRDGKHCKYRCYAATAESRLPVVRNLRERNTQAIRKTCKGGNPNRVTNLIESNLPPKCKVVRIHTSGDMFNYTYLGGWMELARRKPNVRFYFYTKALPLLKKYVKHHSGGVNLQSGILAPNVRVTASYGGTHDHLIGELQIRSASVIMAENETQSPIDQDDTHAVHSGGSFALLIHGVQPAGTKASYAWDKIRRKKGKYAPQKGGD